MNKFNLNVKKIGAFVLAGTLIGTATGCSKLAAKEEETTTAIEAPNEEQEITKYTKYENMLNYTVNGIRKLFSKETNDILSDSAVRNASLVLLINNFAEMDNFSDIRSDIMEYFKEFIDVDNMMYDFNKIKDLLEQTMTSEDKVIAFSEALPEDNMKDKKILLEIERMLNDMLEGYKSSNKEKIVNYFNKFYSLFVEKGNISVSGTEYRVGSLNLADRAVAEVYASVAAYYARNYVDFEKYINLIQATYEENSKAQIHELLAIMENGATKDDRSDVEKVDDALIVAEFENMYSRASVALSKVMAVSDQEVTDLVNYLNIKFLASDKVSETERIRLLGDFTLEKSKAVLDLIDKITKYNLEHSSNIFPLSNLLIDSYLETEEGKTAALASDCILFNSIKLAETVDKNTSYADMITNPYFIQINKFVSNESLEYKDGKGNTHNILWTEISPGVIGVNAESVKYILTSINNSSIDYATEFAKTRVSEGIKFIENIADGECIEPIKTIVK